MDIPTWLLCQHGRIRTATPKRRAIFDKFKAYTLANVARSHPVSDYIRRRTLGQVQERHRCQAHNLLSGWLSDCAMHCTQHPEASSNDDRTVDCCYCRMLHHDEHLLDVQTSRRPLSHPNQYAYNYGPSPPRGWPCRGTALSTNSSRFRRRLDTELGSQHTAIHQTACRSPRASSTSYWRQQIAVARNSRESLLMPRYRGLCIRASHWVELQFPSRVEQILWRVSSLILVGTTALFWVLEAGAILQRYGSDQKLWARMLKREDKKIRRDNNNSRGRISPIASHAIRRRTVYIRASTAASATARCRKR